MLVRAGEGFGFETGILGRGGDVVTGGREREIGEGTGNAGWGTIEGVEGEIEDVTRGAGKGGWGTSG